MLAIVFTCFQFYEYSNAAFNISDGIYGSTFYMATGFHGSSCADWYCIYFCLFCSLYSLTTTHHLGFEAAAWYWHFVDVCLVVLVCNYLLVGVVCEISCSYFVLGGNFFFSYVGFSCI